MGPGALATVGAISHTLATDGDQWQGSPPPIVCSQFAPPPPPRPRWGGAVSLHPIRRPSRPSWPSTLGTMMKAHLTPTTAPILDLDSMPWMLGLLSSSSASPSHPPLAPLSRKGVPLEPWLAMIIERGGWTVLITRSPATIYSALLGHLLSLLSPSSETSFSHP